MEANAPMIEALLGPVDKRTAASYTQVLPLVFDLAVGGKFGSGQSLRISNLTVIGEMLDRVFLKVSLQARVAVVRNLEALVLASPYNGKRMASCTETRLVEKLLGFLLYIEDKNLFDRVLHLAHLLCAHNMSITDVKKYFSVMHRIAETTMEKIDSQSKFYNLIVSLHQTIQKEVRPRSFTDFDGLKQASGIEIPHALVWPKYSYSFSCWFRAETFVDPAQGPSYAPRLFSYNCTDGACVEAFFFTHANQNTTLVVQYTPHAHVRKKTHVAHLNYAFRSKRWYHIVISHTYSLVLTSELKLYVDGAKAATASLRYPGISKPLEHNYIGTNRYQQDGYKTSFSGQLGQIYMFKQALGTKEAHQLYKLGCDFSLCYANKNYFVNNKELLFAYCPKASDGMVLFDNSFELLDKSVKGREPLHARKLPGTTLVEGQSVRNSIFCAGGMEIILPLLVQPYEFAKHNMEFYGSHSVEWGPSDEQQLGQFQASIICLIADLVHGHKAFQNELTTSRAFEIIALLLERHAPNNLCNQIIVAMERLVKNLGQKSLVHQAYRELLFCFRLWHTASYDVQVEALSMLNRLVLQQPAVFRDVIGVQQLIDVLRTFYWIMEDPTSSSTAPVAIDDDILSDPGTPKRGTTTQSRKKTKLAALWLRDSGNSLKTIQNDNLQRFAPAEIRKLRMFILGMVRTMLSEAVSCEEIQGIIAFVQDCQDAYQLEDVLYLLLHLLLNASETFRKIVDCIHELGGIHPFLGLISHKSEAIRVLVIRIIALIYRMSPKKTGKALDQNCYAYITGKLQQYPFEPLTYIALLEVATGYIRVEYTNMTAEFVTTMKSFENTNFLAVIFKLVPSAELTMRQRALQDFSLMLMNSYAAREAFVDQVGFPKWLLSLLADAMRSQHEDSHASVELVLRLLDYLIQHCLKVTDGWKTLETFAAFTNLYSRGSEDAQIQKAYYEHVLSMSAEELRRLDQGAYSDLVVLTNFAHVSCLIEEFLFFPPDAMSGSEKDIKVTLKRDPETHTWLDFNMVQRFLDLLDSLVLSPHADSINQDLLHSDKEKNFYCLILRLTLVSMRESQAIFSASGGTNEPSRAAQRSSKRGSVRLRPMKEQHFQIEDFMAGSESHATVSVRPASPALEQVDPSFAVISGGMRKSEMEKFLDKSAHRLRFLLGRFMKSASGSNINAVRFLAWALSYLIRTLRKGVRGQALLHKPTVTLFKELVREYGPELEAFLGERFPEMEGIEPYASEEQFYRYFDALDNNFALQVHIEEVKNGIEEELALQLPEAAKRRAKMMIAVTETIKNLMSVDFSREQEITSTIGKVRDSQTYQEVNRRISWLMSEAERFHKIEYRWSQLQRYVSNNEAYPWLQGQGVFQKKYWTLDSTEDPMRRRWKLKLNYEGTDYKEYSQAFIREQQESRKRARDQQRLETSAAEQFPNESSFFSLEDVDEDEAVGGLPNMPEALVHSVSVPLAEPPSPAPSVPSVSEMIVEEAAAGGSEPAAADSEQEDWCIVDEKDSLKPSFFRTRNSDEKSLCAVACDLISPKRVVPGTLEVTDKAVYFFAADHAEITELPKPSDQLSDSSDGWNVSKTDHSVKPSTPKRNWSLDRKWSLGFIRGVHRRRYMLRNTALEVFLIDQRNFLVDFPHGIREKIFSAIVGTQPPNLVDFTYKKTPQEILKKSDITGKWQRREISNFEYLMYLNTVAGRTYNDLSQYPVFPWILTDYTSDSIDLSDRSVYRDLSKPVGALNPKRLEEFQMRYDNLPEDESMPKFYYGSHYSTALVVLYYLIRLEPFTSLYLQLQGRFDHADRMFDSVATAWANSYNLAQDVKELIPEFFYNSMFFKNTNGLDLGQKQNDEQINDIQLPPWAHGSPEEFVRINREALESEIVSESLHLWIDLIFGAAQRGHRAAEAKNIFYHLTYEGAVNIDAIEDPVLRQSTMEQILCFGQCPSQLFTKPHPPRKGRKDVQSVFDNPSLFQISGEQDLKITAKQIFVSGDRLATVGSTGQFRMFRFVAPSGGGFVSFNSLHSSLTTPLCAVSMSDKLIAGGRDRPRFYVDMESKTMISFCYWDSSIRLCSLQASITMLQGVRMHKAAVTCLQPTESLSAVVSGSLDGNLMVWKTERHRGRPLQLNPKPRFVLRGHIDAVSCIAVSERLDVVISGSQSGSLIVHTLHSGRFVRSFLDNPSESFLSGGIDFILVTSLAKVVVFSHATQWMVVYDINGVQLASCQLSGVKLPVRDMAVTSDGKHILVAGKQLHIYCAHSLELFKSFDVSEEIYSLSFILEERYLLLGLRSGRLISCCMSASPV